MKKQIREAIAMEIANKIGYSYSCIPEKDAVNFDKRCLFKIADYVMQQRIEELRDTLVRAKDKKYTKKLLIEYLEIMIESLEK